MTDSSVDEALKVIRSTQRRARLKVIALLLAAIALAGTIPIALGGGYFGWKMFRYDNVRLYFVNDSGESVRLSIGSASDQEYAHDRVHNVEFRAGEVTLTVTGADGQIIEELPLETDNQSIFYNFQGRFCFLVMDVTQIYVDGEVNSENVEVVGRIGRDDTLYLIPPHGRFVTPRGILPERVPGDQEVIWIEDVACALLDAGEDRLLVAQQLIEHEQRRDALEALERQAEEQRGTVAP